MSQEAQLPLQGHYCRHPRERGGWRGVDGRGLGEATVREKETCMQICSPVM